MTNALVSPETGLATMSANVAVGDWYVAAGNRRCVRGASLCAIFGSFRRYSHLNLLAAFVRAY